MTTPLPTFSPQFRREFSQLVRWRRDVRHFKPDPVDGAIVSECLELANLAPSVGLSQPWRFVELQDPARCEQVIASFRRCNREALGSYDEDVQARYAKLKLEGLSQAPVQLVVFADPATPKGKSLGRRTMPEMLHYSVVTAVHTFWLAARSHGLGVGWVSILEPGDVADACNAPADWSLVAYLCIGWPLEQADQPELERTGWERRAGLDDNFTRL
ncbi:MAG: 5,6-dimethylbenzimidazole synthase [Rhizobiales bacterium]|nr:5,6-dimethylbenzimidazole synthase [Hyphomicrobiales bacterium]